MTQGPIVSVIVNDASCLIDLRKARLLHLLVRLPYRVIIPLPVRVSEVLGFTLQEWAILDDGGMETFDLPPDRVAEAFSAKARYPKLSANDCFCLVAARCYRDAILLTGDGPLRRVAKGDGRRVHGVLWVVDELRRLTICEDNTLAAALEIWRDDPTVFLPVLEIDYRLRLFGRS